MLPLSKSGWTTDPWEIAYLSMVDPFHRQHTHYRVVRKPTKRGTEVYLQRTHK